MKFIASVWKFTHEKPDEILAPVSMFFGILGLREAYHLRSESFTALVEFFWPYKAYIIVSLVVLAGILAHIFKARNQRLYGIVEVAFGAGSALSVSLGIKPGAQMFAQWASLIGCVYVIARGLNNSAGAAPKKVAQPLSVTNPKMLM